MIILFKNKSKLTIFLNLWQNLFWRKLTLNENRLSHEDEETFEYMEVFTDFFRL